MNPGPLEQPVSSQGRTNKATGKTPMPSPPLVSQRSPLPLRCLLPFPLSPCFLLAIRVLFCLPQRVFIHYVLGKMLLLFFLCHPGTLATCDGQAYLRNRYANRDLVKTESELVSYKPTYRVYLIREICGYCCSKGRSTSTQNHFALVTGI